MTVKVRFTMGTKHEAKGQTHITNGEMEFPDGTPLWLAYGFLSNAKVKLAGKWRGKTIPAKWAGPAEPLAPGAREVGVREMTPAEIDEAATARALVDVEYRKQQIAKLLAMETGGENPTE